MKSYRISKEDPPWFALDGSPIENDMTLKLGHRLAYGIEFVQEFECRTKIGAFRLDFAILSGKRRVGVECDGARFHEAYHDSARDAAIVGQGFVDVIYRLKGRDIYRLPDEPADCLSWLEPLVFFHGSTLQPSWEVSVIRHDPFPGRAVFTEATDCDRDSGELIWSESPIVVDFTASPEYLDQLMRRASERRNLD